MLSNVDEVVSRIMATPGGNNRECWAKKLTGEAAEVVRRLREEERNGNKPNRLLVLRALVDNYGVTTSERGVRHHLTGVCRCE